MQCSDSDERNCANVDPMRDTKNVRLQKFILQQKSRFDKKRGLQMNQQYYNTQSWLTTKTNLSVDSGHKVSGNLK